jgi:DNA-binding NtrC family response regulator
MDHHRCAGNVVPLPFLVAARAASAPAPGRFGPLYGGCEAMQEVYRRIEKVAPTSATVLVTGESGSGKELVARAIHERSKHAGGPFVAVNCGAIPASLIEAELFGHEKGAFTGAAKVHRGYFERAEDGSILLDEVTEMAPQMQVRLLRVLESGRFNRVGGEAELMTRVRVIAATNRDPRQSVLDGSLRADLMYRLAVFPIGLPPLRERAGDVELLAEHFLTQLNARESTAKVFSRAAIAALRGHGWPGNVRELRNAVERAFILADADVELDVVAEDAAVPPRAALNVPIGAPLAEIEQRAICATLDLCAGNKRRCAQVLGISLKTLYNRLAEYRGGGAAIAMARQLSPGCSHL